MTVETALTHLVPGLLEIYGDLVERIVLFGSTARGTQTEESDVDVALFLHADATQQMEEQALELEVDLGLACRKVFSVITIDRDRFQEWRDLLPFYQNIQREGIVLWPAA